MKRHHLLLLLLIALWVVGVALALTPGSAPGSTHPVFGPMDASALPQANEQTWLLGLIFGLLIIAVFVAMLGFGVGVHDPGPFRLWLIVGGLLYAGTFVFLMFTFRDYEAGKRPFLGAFPLPTTLVLFGLWPAPIFFAVLYVAGFKRWIMTPEDSERFQELVANTKNSRQEET